MRLLNVMLMELLVISMRNCIYIFLLLVLCSCGAHRYLPVESQKDSITVVIKESVVYKDSIIYVEVPVEVEKVIIPEADTSRLETSVAKSEAWIDQGKLRHTLENKSNVQLPKKVELPTYEKEKKVEKVVEKVVVHEVEVEKPLNSWQTFRMVLGTITLIAIGIWLLYKIIRRLLVKI